MEFHLTTKHVQSDWFFFTLAKVKRDPKNFSRGGEKRIDFMNN